MGDPTNSSTETAENSSENNRTLSDVDTDTLSDFDESMSCDPSVKLPNSDVEFDSDGEVIDRREDNVKMVQNVTPLLKREENINENQVQTPSGPSSYYPEIIEFNEEQVNIDIGYDINRASTSYTQSKLSQDNRSNLLRQQARQSRKRNRAPNLVLNRNTCVRKNTKRKPFNEKQISELEKEFQKTRLTSPTRSTKEDFFDLTPESDYDSEGYQQQALSDENYVDLNEIILRNVSLSSGETRNGDAESIKKEEDLPSWMQIDYKDLGFTILSHNIIFQTESVLRAIDPKEEDSTHF